MAYKIHPTAIIDSKAELDSSVEVGAYSIIGAGVKVGADTRIGSHVVLKGQQPLAKIIKFFSFRHWGSSRKIKNTEMSRLRWKLAITTLFASSAPLIAEQFKIKARLASATITGLWLMCTSRTIVKSATTPLWPTTARLQATWIFMITRFWAASRSYISFVKSARMSLLQ
jgi:hypothetical protein